MRAPSIKRSAAFVAAFALSSLSLSHWSFVEPVENAIPTVSSDVSTTWRCVAEDGATLFEADNTNDVINECVEIATTAGRRTLGVERVDSESVLTRTLESRVHGSSEVGLTAADAQFLAAITGSTTAGSGGAPALTRWAGLTPSHFVKHYTQIAGASSDYDTTTTDWSLCTVEDGSDFCTLGEAMQNCSAGDIIGIYAYDGIYVGQDDPGNNANPFWKCAAGGSEGNLVWIVAEYSAAYLGGTPADLIADPDTYLAAVASSPNRVQLSNGVTDWTGLDPEDPGIPPTNGSPTFGCTSATDYVAWVGIFVDGEVSKHNPDTGQAFFQGADCELHQAVIRGADIPFTDNNDPLRLQNSTGFHGKNLIIYDSHRIAPAGENHNAAAVMTYDGQNFLLEHMFVYDAYLGFYIKGAQPNGNSGTIRYSFITGVNDGLELGDDDGTPIIARENIVEYAQIGAQIGGAVQDTSNVHVLYNTFYSVGTGPKDALIIGNLLMGEDGHRIENNLLVTTDNGNSETINGGAFTQANSAFNIDANHHYQAGGNINTAWNGTTYPNDLSGFQMASGATNDTTGNPDFVDAANSNYRLGGSTTATGKGAFAVDSGREHGLQTTPTL